jgi:hypothetical protein
MKKQTSYPLTDAWIN